MDNFGFLFAALLVVWIGIFVYIYYIGQKLNDLRQQLSEVEIRENQNTAVQSKDDQ